MELTHNNCPALIPALSPGPPLVQPMPEIKAVVGESLQIICPASGYPLDRIAWAKGWQSWEWQVNLLGQNYFQLIKNFPPGTDWPSSPTAPWWSAPWWRVTRAATPAPPPTGGASPPPPRPTSESSVGWAVDSQGLLLLQTPDRILNM